MELRVHYPHSVWGKVRTWFHRNVTRCDISTRKSQHGGLVVFDDSCRDAWWS